MLARAPGNGRRVTVPTASSGTDDHLTVTIRGREVPVVLPSRGDPRLRLATVLITVQVLGQTVLGFKLSVAQILVTIGVTGLVEAILTLRRERALVWPASALLTGNSVALLLRANGTEHGDWWSLNGIHWFLLAALVSLASKYVVRAGGRHVFNPSNLGLVGVLLVVGAGQVFPQYLYWGPLEAPLVITVAVLAVGAVWVLRPLGMLPLVASFMVPFAGAIAVLALGGQAFFALWAVEPVGGWFYWLTIVLSPETMIFLFFMMSDPRTAPRTTTGRVLFGSATALVAVALIAPQQTEYGVKVALLASLTVSCALTPLIERAATRVEAGRAVRWEGLDVRRLRDAARRPAMLLVALITVAAVANTVALADDQDLVLLERGLSEDPDPQ